MTALLTEDTLSSPVSIDHLLLQPLPAGQEDVVAAAPAAPQKETPQVAESPAAEPLDVSLFGDPQRSVQYLSYAGLLKNDDAITALNLLKRINHAAFADYANDGFEDDTGKRIAALQADFRTKMKSMDFGQLVAEGHVNALLESCLGALADYHKGEAARLDATPVCGGECKEPAAFNRQHERCEKKHQKYAMELAYWQGEKQKVKEAISRYPQALQAGEYLTIGDLAKACGMVDADASKAGDMIDDTLANAAAHSLTLMARPFQSVSDADMKRYGENPAAFSTQILALADRLAQGNTSLSKAQPQEKSSPGLGRVQALKTLLSAQIHAAVTWKPHAPGGKPAEGADLPHLAGVLARVKPLIGEYQSAAMSLAHHFLGEGPGKNDPRMIRLREQLGRMMEKEDIVLLPAAEATAKAESLARASAQDLMQVAADCPGKKAKLAKLLSQVSPELGKETLTARPQIIGTDVQALVQSLKAFSDDVMSKIQAMAAQISPSAQLQVTQAHGADAAQKAM